MRLRQRPASRLRALRPAATGGLCIGAVNAGHLLDAGQGYYMGPILTILLGTLVRREWLTKLQRLPVVVMGVIIAAFRYRQAPWVALPNATAAVDVGISRGVYRRPRDPVRLCLDGG